MQTGTVEWSIIGPAHFRCCIYCLYKQCINFDIDWKFLAYILFANILWISMNQAKCFLPRKLKQVYPIELSSVICEQTVSWSGPCLVAAFSLCCFKKSFN